MGGAPAAEAPAAEAGPSDGETGEQPELAGAPE
jgi:hypothetical protein